MLDLFLKSTTELSSSAWPAPSSFPETDDPEEREVYDILALPLGALIIIANISALVSMVYNRHLEHPAYRYVASLALTDTGVGIYLIVINSTETTFAEDLSCVARISVVMALCVISIMCILVIAIDRYLFLVHAVYYYQLATFRYSLILLITLWVTGTAVGFVPLMGWVNPTRTEIEPCTFINVVAAEYIMVMIVLFFTVPMLLITLLYGRILHLVIQQRRRLLQQTQPLYEQPFHGTAGETTQRRSTAHSRSGIGLLRGLRAAKVVILIVAAFLLTWFPFFVATFVQIICGTGCHVMDTIAPYLSLLGFFNSVLNPCIYAFFGLEIRKNSCNFTTVCWRHLSLFCARPSRVDPQTTLVIWRVL